MITSLGFSPEGAISAVPKSTTIPTRILPATSDVPSHSEAKSGAAIGSVAGMSLLLAVKVQPSTSPSFKVVVGPVIAAVHVDAPALAWK
ncbi:unannotated protein [freshwater metagenome]|uniref:Unannotated protein n=1 Tax=freshwater metagenome TaxID=449393 RepID=A0A6J7JTT5_9ZZZZ